MYLTTFKRRMRAMGTTMEIDDPSTKDTLWHTMRADFEQYYPETKNNNLLMCCACGRLLPVEAFTVEHILPQQMLQDDPPEVKANPVTTRGVRAGLTLLCNAPLRPREGQTRRLGCNAWKGQFYDTALREVLSGTIQAHKFKPITDNHTIALLCAAYLGMAREYGYQIALTAAGNLMRRQFFLPRTFHRDLPLRSQMFLMGQPPEYTEGHLDFWSRPFKIEIDRGSCLVLLRAVVVYVPISRDPTMPIARHLKIAPTKYRLRPNLSVAFE